MLGRKKYRKGKSYSMVIAAYDLRKTVRFYTRREVVIFNQHTSERDAVEIAIQRVCDGSGDETLTPDNIMVSFYSLVRNYDLTSHTKVWQASNMNTTIHPNAHPLAGQTVILSAGPYEGSQYEIEDYWDRISGGSWMDSEDPDVIKYALTGLSYRVPLDNEVLYGQINGVGYLVRVAWL